MTIIIGLWIIFGIGWKTLTAFCVDCVLDFAMLKVYTGIEYGDFNRGEIGRAALFHRFLDVP